MGGAARPPVGTGWGGFRYYHPHQFPSFFGGEAVNAFSAPAAAQASFGGKLVADVSSSLPSVASDCCGRRLGEAVRILAIGRLWVGRLGHRSELGGVGSGTITPTQSRRSLAVRLPLGPPGGPAWSIRAPSAAKESC